VAIGHVKRGEAEANTLDLAAENYMLGNLVHYGFYINSKWPLIQAANYENEIKVHQDTNFEYNPPDCNHLVIGCVSHKVLQSEY
jgi:hypothetical protein